MAIGQIRSENRPNVLFVPRPLPKPSHHYGTLHTEYSVLGYSARSQIGRSPRPAGHAPLVLNTNCDIPVSCTTQVPYLIAPDVLADLLRIQGRLPLLDAEVIHEDYHRYHP